MSVSIWVSCCLETSSCRFPFILMVIWQSLLSLPIPDSEWPPLSFPSPLPLSSLHPFASYDYSIPSSKWDSSILACAFLLGFVECTWLSCILWLRSIYKWIHTTHVLLELHYLTQDDILKFYSFACKIHNVFVFNGWIVYHYEDVPHFLQWRDIYVVSSFWILQIKLLST